MTEQDDTMIVCCECPFCHASLRVKSHDGTVSVIGATPGGGRVRESIRSGRWTKIWEDDEEDDVDET